MVALRDAYTDFMLSRQAMNCTLSTLEFYKYTAGQFLEWIESRGVTSPEEVTARYVREYIAEPVTRGKKDTTVCDHARATVLTAEQLKQIVNACNVRDKAIVLFMADRGLCCALTWKDVNMQSGLVRVKQGKGKKDHSAVIATRNK